MSHARRWKLSAAQLADMWSRWKAGGRVIRLGRCYAGRTEVGIEFMDPAPDFWLIDAGHERVQVELPAANLPLKKTASGHPIQSTRSTELPSHGQGDSQPAII